MQEKKKELFQRGQKNPKLKTNLKANFSKESEPDC